MVSPCFPGKCTKKWWLLLSAPWFTEVKAALRGRGLMSWALAEPLRRVSPVAHGLGIPAAMERRPGKNGARWKGGTNQQKDQTWQMVNPL